MAALAMPPQGQDSQPAPDGWQRFALRPEIAPRFFIERAKEGGCVLGLAGQGHPAVNGRWQRTVAVEAGKFYAFTAQFRAADVGEPERSVLAHLTWLAASGKPIGQGDFPAAASGTEGGPGASAPAAEPGPQAGDWVTVRGLYPAPKGAVGARMELHLRWSPAGRVLWRGAELKAADPPPPRKVRLAAVNLRPRNTRSAEENLRQFVALLDEAAKVKPDIVCLPEGITLVGTPANCLQVAEPVPGPTTRRLGQAARRGGFYLVAGLYERDGQAVYNTAVLIARDGKLVGKYRKTCLPNEEIEGGLAPGAEYPVFQTDFGRVGIMICWDVSYPEVARELARKGAEVILMPIWGGNETLANARAIENQVYLVTSGYDFPTLILDQAGNPLAQGGRQGQIISAEVDLNQRLLWPWLGDWKARIWREAPARPKVQGR